MLRTTRIFSNFPVLADKISSPPKRKLRKIPILVTYHKKIYENFYVHNFSKFDIKFPHSGPSHSEPLQKALPSYYGFTTGRFEF